MILRAKRKSKFENRYHKNMGLLKCRVVTIKLYLFGIIPVKTLHKYRETYSGEVKNLSECKLSEL